MAMTRDPGVRQRGDPESDEMGSRLHLRERMILIGQMAAGLAHELNNPIGFAQNNFFTLKRDVAVMRELLDAYRALAEEAGGLAAFAAPVEQIRDMERRAKLDVVLRDMDALFDETQDGFRRAGAIISGIMSFARSDDQAGGLKLFNINKAVETLLVIAKNEYKYHCSVLTQLGDIPEVECLPNQITHALLTLVLSVARDIAGQQRPELGTIRISTYDAGEHVCCKIAGGGGASSTTSGQSGNEAGPLFGIAREIIVDTHHGAIDMESRTGEGAAFVIRLPKKASRV